MLGILGGMGPMATARFYRLLVERTPATTDQQHIPVAIWADPATPDRTSALLCDGPSPVPALLRGLRWLRAAGARCVAMPCGTAHAFREELVRRSGVDILDMVAAAIQEARSLDPHARCIGVMATRGTRDTQLYERAASSWGIEIMHVAVSHQQHLDAAIAAVKRGAGLAEAADSVAAATRALRDEGAQLVIAGCSEIPLVAHKAAGVLPLVDSVGSLADIAVRRMHAVEPEES